jgi:anaerobic ribonucleoside-triphosphate reductase activating protein
MTLPGRIPHQQFIHLTRRYHDFDPCHHRIQIEIQVRPNGDVAIAGFLTTDGLTRLTAGLDLRRPWPVCADHRSGLN